MTHNTGPDSVEKVLNFHTLSTEVLLKELKLTGLSGSLGLAISRVIG